MTLLASVSLALLSILIGAIAIQKLMESQVYKQWSSEHLSDESFNYWMGKYRRNGDV